MIHVCRFARTLLPLTVCVLLSLGGLAMPSAFGDELFVTDRVTNRILAFDADTGAFSRVLVDEGLNIPSGLAFGPGGLLYVSNLGSGAVLKVNPETGATSPYALIGGPSGLAYDAASNTMFVAEFGQFDGDEVYQIDAASQIVNVIGTGSGATGRSGLAIRDGDLYAGVFGTGATFAGSVLKFDGGNSFASEGTIASDPTMSGANGVAFDAAGNLYVVGLLSQGIKKFSISGGPATAGTNFGIPLAYPSSVLIEQQGDSEVMYVTSLGNDNPADPIYGNFLFPGGIYKFDVATGNLIGNGPFIESGGVSDFNNDGSVDGEDLTLWSEEFGDSGEVTADSNLDGVVDGADFLIWQRNAGKLGDFQPTAIVRYTPPAAAVTAIPEPATMVLSGAALIAIGVASRRR
jgi:hypothetical protein